MAYLRSVLMLSRGQYLCLGPLISLFFVICQGCAQSSSPPNNRPSGDISLNGQGQSTQIVPGAEDLQAYLPLLKDKKIGLVVNHTSMVGKTHLVDTLQSLGINVVTIFAPEHGFRGAADAGAHIRDSVDAKTGIQITSLYGDKKKPSRKDLQDIEIMVFDIQDVGVRFYTYISTLHYIMEACADLDLPLVVLDRPNPNGHYIDGPIMDTTRFQSFVGMHPIPVVYGMTIGELGLMINGEKWIAKQCELTVIPCRNYDHTSMYDLPLKPSPNLPNLRSILLYPGICFFEGTPLSLGRGTSSPFQVVGHPDYPDHSFSFAPKAVSGAMSPPLKDKTCYGIDLTQTNVDSLFKHRKLDLSILLKCYAAMNKATFFNASWYDKLAGTSSFRESIMAGWNEQQIRDSWKMDLDRFNVRRKLYLLYEDFE